MPRSPWYRALTGCLQTIPRDDQDIDVEAGDVEVGELRERPFWELARALDPEQRLCFATLALADLAVWPEVDLPLARQLIATLDGSFVPGPAQIFSTVRGTQADTCAIALASRILPRTKAAGSLSDVVTVWAELRAAVHAVLRRHPQPILATEQWLRRLVPLATQLRVEEATSLARGALSRSFGVDEPWVFAASRYDKSDGAVIGLLSATRPSARLKSVARFSPYELVGRTLRASVEPLVPLDGYRLRYLFRSLYLEDATRDAELGSYDQAVCRDIASGEEVVLLGL